ncbi:hypothetical protein PV327_007353 [Microctonus hyperodae]|uniref:Uncharacterized protein n=1 Tax=Microctonus hyperodae TaxID=165561 RepID=A0AA39FZ05_MICHY|nr:hypothetical protein PV327_007353 [Microctonus hyperodae]
MSDSDSDNPTNENGIAINNSLSKMDKSDIRYDSPKLHSVLDNGYFYHFKTLAPLYKIELIFVLREVVAFHPSFIIINESYYFKINLYGEKGYVRLIRPNSSSSNSDEDGITRPMKSGSVRNKYGQCSK